MTKQGEPQPEEEFYIGYASQLPPGIKKFLLRFIPSLILGVLVFSIVIPLVHDQFNPGKVGGDREFEGLLLTEPVPHLAVPRQGDTSSGMGYSRYLLTGRGKTAPKPEILEQAGQWVKLVGRPIYRNNQTLVATKSAEAIAPPAALSVQPAAGTSLGNFSLKGEILDAKCYLGTMKPGHTKTHRACGIRCISGGVPPVFIVRNKTGDAMYFVLADSNGKAVNSRILDMVADPIQITGEVVRYDDMFVLKADPQTYELL